MTDRPIIFSAPMVKALLARRKTQTRRIVKDAPEFFGSGRPEDRWSDLGSWGWRDEHLSVWRSLRDGYLPVGLQFASGDRLWVREAWRTWAHDDEKRPAAIEPGFPRVVRYEADEALSSPVHPRFVPGRLRASIHMPRWASRLTLHVTEVRVQRLHEISREDAIAEGLALAWNAPEEFWRWPPPHHAGLWLSPIAAYRALWNHIHGADAWDANPWVAAITFTLPEGTPR